MRIDTLSSYNSQMQGKERREWFRQHAPQHLKNCATFVSRGLTQRSVGTSRSSLILGAGACTEVPLSDVARSSEEVVLADLDLNSMQRGRDELLAASLRKRIRFVQCDISGGVSSNLTRLLRREDWSALAAAGGQAFFDAAARCLEQCPVPDPPTIHTLRSGDFGLVVSSLVLSQLFSYPLLDVLDRAQQASPDLLLEQERHRRYQDAAQNFRIKVINAHLHYMRSLLDLGGIAVLLTDIRGFAFDVHGTDHDATHRRTLPLVPRTFPDLIKATFEVVEEGQWEWLTDLPDNERPGRGYEIGGYILKSLDHFFS
ncbi:hypothetical protein KDW_34840 [Dictyobacter vulcani]|uniref:Histidine-specific methyltransferase SAM-dependent domain-containing protein n=1 Tax=Dictyobacter vulcani TaxID=2607529 RepID=A0A5J4KQ42_9CHLR|nr:hypothetical protein [Dictyobacter vulcani]GER89322.1 hypothetical protein KDW_34840 [Dictyobacter vulcani]